MNLQSIISLLCTIALLLAKDVSAELSNSRRQLQYITPWYEHHGQCDLVMMKDEIFADGLGLHMHIRTKIVGYWSYIQSVAIKLGNDILEIEGSSDPTEDEAHYWFNHKYQGDLKDVAGFPVTHEPSSNAYKRSFAIDLSSKYPGQNITVETYKEFVRVRFNETEDVYGNTVGILGDCKTGKTYARDGVTSMDDLVALGDEWQVLPYEPRLFHEPSHPQYPEQCVKPEDPNSERSRRLVESAISIEKAEATCGAALADPLTVKECVYHILATQDLDMVGAF
mmetsp:Transcript_2076/g.4693  ORF Transcript_2076/g.4693 Transcript_2076/m.4693 type:complete len:281 (-) Transcript_2076:119-961(-)